MMCVTWPAPAVEWRVAGLVLDKVVVVLGLGVNVIAGVGLDVRIDDGDELAAIVSQVAHHVLGRGKLELVPGEVALAVRVLDVEPHDVHGNLVLLEAVVDRAHVLLVVVVPAALMIGEREYGRQLCVAREQAVLTEHVVRSRTHHHVDVDDAALREPVRVHLRRVRRALHELGHFG